MLPQYSILSTLCKVGVGVSVVAIAYFTFSKRKDFLATLPLYVLFASAAVMATHTAFLRYGIIALPVWAVTFSVLINLIPKTRMHPKVLPAVLLAIIIISSVVMLPYINHVKLERNGAENQAQYLSRVFPEGDAWQWINQNTPANATIATYDIKQYYINRSILELDANASVPLYQMSTVQECISFLQEKGVSYVMSVPWASPGDDRMPLAYGWCPFTKYFGDVRYFPPLFVGDGGTTVYHVGPLNETTVEQAFAQDKMVAPTKNVTFSFALSSSTHPYEGQFYVPIPVDYRAGVLTASFNGSLPLEIQLWYGQIAEGHVAKPSKAFALMGQWSLGGGDGLNARELLLHLANYKGWILHLHNHLTTKQTCLSLSTRR